MERTSYLRLLWASKLWLGIFAIAAAVVVYAFSSIQDDQYESEALGQIVSTSQAEGEILTEEELISLSNLYHELAGTSTVLEIAHEEPDVSGHEAEFDDAVTVQPEARVGVLGFVANTGNPETAANFANAYANAFSTYLDELQLEQRRQSLRPVIDQIDRINNELSKIESGDPQGAGLEIERQALQERIANEAANPGDSMRVIEPAIPHSEPVSPNPKRDALLALIGALVLGAAIVYLRDLLFDRYRSADEAARELRLPLLGEIPKGSNGSALESFRTLRTGLMLSLEQVVTGNPKRQPTGGVSLLVTGGESGCGKSYVTSNLAQTLATEGREVVAVDADLRRPTLHRQFSVALVPGLSDLLLHDTTANASERTRRVRVQAPSGGSADGDLRVLPAGENGEAAVERLSSERMHDLVFDLRTENDVTVFDSPPTGIVVDPIVLSRYADGVLFVIDSRRTRRRDARRAVEALRAVGAPIIGFAYNRSRVKPSSYSSYRPRELRKQPWQPKETRV